MKSTVNNSPLFQTRTQRATNQQHDNISSQYVGKGKSNYLLILQRPNEVGSFRDVISRIQSMDDASFQRFVSIAVSQLSKEEKLMDVTSQQLITGLNQIRYIPHAFMDYSISNNRNITVQPSPTACWFPGCLILYIVVLIVLYITMGPNTTRYCIYN